MTVVERDRQPATIVAARRSNGPSSRAAPALPRSLQHLVGPPGQQAGRLTYHGLRVIEVDLPVTRLRELGELLAVHDGVARAS